MIIFTKQGVREDVPYLFGYQGGVFIFQFLSDTLTYQDPTDGAVWTWEGMMSSLEEVVGVNQSGRNLFPVLNVNDCIALTGSFYWDDTNGYLYVHWFEDSNDNAISRAQSSYQRVIPGYSNGYHANSGNFFDGIYYEPLITSVSNFTTRVDPTKLGLIRFENPSYALSNDSGRFDYTTAEESVGIVTQFFFVPDDATELLPEHRILSAFATGYTTDRDTIQFQLAEARLFDNAPVCKNVMSLTDYPDAGDREGDLIPTAWGTIRRGIMVPTNAGTLTKAASGSVTFLVADPSITSITSITKVYDDEDEEITIDSFDLAACTVTVTKPADVSPSNLKDWKWEGVGYAIDGTVNNGLDIIRAAYLYLADIPFLISTFDTTQWALETVKNTAPCGISIQSEKGFIEELIEPITTSLQGVVKILGDGRITFFSREITAPVSETLTRGSQVDEPALVIDDDETVSEILIQYSPDFTTDTSLNYLYTENRVETIRDYGINRREPISPVETVLVLESSVIALGNELSSTSANPERRVSVNNISILDVNPFNIIAIDTAKNADSENLEYGELLLSNPNYNENTQEIEIRVLPNYTS